MLPPYLFRKRWLAQAPAQVHISRPRVVAVAAASAISAVGAIFASLDPRSAARLNLPALRGSASSSSALGWILGGGDPQDWPASCSMWLESTTESTSGSEGGFSRTTAKLRRAARNKLPPQWPARRWQTGQRGVTKSGSWHHNTLGAVEIGSECARKDENGEHQSKLQTNRDRQGHAGDFPATVRTCLARTSAPTLRRARRERPKWTLYKSP